MKNTTICKKRIAFYIGSLCIGGAERVISNLAEYFYQEGYEVYMLTKLKEDIEYELRPEIPRIIADITSDEETGSRIGNLKARIDKLTRIWEEIKPDIIVSFIRKNNLMALASARPLQIPVVVSVRSAPARELSGKGMKQLTFAMFRMAAGVVLQTREAKEFFPAYIQKKAIVLANSINPGFLNAMENIDTSVAREKQIMTVGRIDDNKNQKMLVEAFAAIANKYPDWTLELCGDGSGRKSLEKRVAELGLTDRINFNGDVSDVPARLAKASIFVLPSRVEGMPNALIEAMVMGCACISTDCPCGGPRDLINEDESNGILIPVDDVNVLTTSLERLINSDDMRVKIGTEATKLIDRLHPDQVNRQWKEYIESIIG